MDASATSLHSSGRDSGLDMSREVSGSPPRQTKNSSDKLNKDWEAWKEREMQNQRKCICSNEKKKNGDDSR